MANRTDEINRILEQAGIQPVRSSSSQPTSSWNTAGQSGGAASRTSSRVDEINNILTSAGIPTYQTKPATAFPQSQRSLLKEAQMNRQDSSAAQSRAAPASTGQNYGSAAAEATFGFLNQNGVSTKYTQELSKAAQSPAAQSQTAQMGQRLGSAALEGTLGYLNQNGVSTRYTQGLTQPQTARNQTAPNQKTQNQTAQTSQRQPAQNQTPQANQPYSGMSSGQLRDQRNELAKTNATLGFLAQNGVNTAYMQNLLQDNSRQLEQTQVALSQAVEREKPRTNEKRDSLIRQLEELNRYSGYAVTQEANDSYQQQRQAILDQIHAEDEALGNLPRSYDAQDRTERTVSGSLKQYGGATVNAGTTFLDFQGKYQSGILTQEDLIVAQMMGLSVEEYGKLKQESYNSQQTRDFFDQGYALADRLSEEGARDIATAQEGLSEIGRFGIDVSSNIIQTSLDAAGRATGLGMIPFFIRAAGGGAQEARQEGASLEQQMLYGAVKGGIEVATEKMFDGLAGAFGKGAFDDVVESGIRKFVKTDIGRTFLRMLVNGSAEGLEEVVSDLADPFAKLIYNNQALKEAWENRGELAEQMLYDYLVGCAMGTIGNVGSIATGQDAQKNAEARQRDTAEWLESETLQNQQRDALEAIQAANQTRNAQTGAQNAVEATNYPVGSPLTQDEQNSILNPYLNAYYNYLNSASSEAQSPNVFSKAPVSRDEQLGRYFDEAWDTEDFVSPL